MNIDWSKLKNNKYGKGFEDLAIDYLKSNFSGTWIQTGQTRDGNKDAFKIVLFNKESWAEAKFSKHSHISRYRLDATIVSAIISDQQIVEVIFITNCLIDNTTQIDIEKALKNALGKSYRNTFFKTKLDIEYWLYNNPQKYRKYFSGDLKNNEFLFDKLIVTDFISFLTPVRQSIFFREPLKELHVGGIYEITFSIFSPWDSKQFDISINTDIIVLSTNKIFLNKGNNGICLKIKCLKEGELPIRLLKINETEVNTYRRLYVKKEKIFLHIEAQNRIKEKIITSLLDFKQNDISFIHGIKGCSGIGKSSLIDEILTLDSFDGIDIIYQSLSKDDIDNGILLINIILSVFFYHSFPGLIDKVYLEQIKKQTYISNFLKELIEVKLRIEEQKRSNYIEDFNSKIAEYSKEKNIFPGFIKLNKKVIVLDDLHKLNSLSRNFLFSFLSDIYSSNIPCFIILSGRNSFWQTPEYLKFVEMNRVECHYYELTNDDLFINLFNCGYAVDKYVLSILSSRINLNVYFLTLLIKYLKRNENSFEKSDPDSCHVIINQFISEDRHIQSVLNIFRDLSTKNTDLLRVVYYSFSGIEKKLIKPDVIEMFENLEMLGYIKLNNNLRYVPVHDFYQSVFKQSFTPPSLDLITNYINYKPTDIEKERESLVYSHDMDIDQLNLLVNNITCLINQHKFYSVLYILEPYFSKFINRNNDLKVIQINRLGEKYFYELMFYYVYSVANCDKEKNSIDEFYTLYKEIRNNNSPDIKLIFIKVVSELINSSFENLLFDKMENYTKELQESIILLKVEGYMSCDNDKCHPSLLLSRETKILYLTMLDRLNEAYNEYQNITEDLSKYGNINKKAILDIRFFSLLCCYDIHLSYIKMNEAIISLAKSDESKWILIGQLEVLFLESLEKKRINFKDMKNIHQKMKTDYFNDYRKGCLIIAACYIYVRMKEQANQYLYSHYFDKRKMNNRYKAMHLGLLAIYEYIFNNNIHISIDYLEKQQFLYSKLGDSYKNIIIHNINVMRKRVPDVQVDFYVNNKLSNDTLYIDPRFF